MKIVFEARKCLEPVCEVDRCAEKKKCACDVVYIYTSSVGMLVKLLAFLGTLRWPAGGKGISRLVDILLGGDCHV